MRITLLNPPHPSIGSRIPDEHLPPLGLLSLGGPLLDAGHPVQLVDADLDDLPPGEILRRVAGTRPELLLVGHSGSTSAHPVTVRLTRALKLMNPQLRIIYGGVFPTYHWREVLKEEPQIDVVVRGEGEDTVVKLADALAAGRPLETVRGIAFRKLGAPFATEAAAAIDDLDVIPRGLGADRPPPLHLLGRQARGGGAVLPGLSAPVQLLRSARLLDPLAPPRPGALRQGDRPAAPGAGRGGVQLRRREPDLVAGAVEGAPARR